MIIQHQIIYQFQTTLALDYGTESTILITPPFNTYLKSNSYILNSFEYRTFFIFSNKYYQDIKANYNWNNNIVKYLLVFNKYLIISMVILITMVICLEILYLEMEK